MVLGLMLPLLLLASTAQISPPMAHPAAPAPVAVGAGAPARPLKSDDDRIFRATDYGAVDDGETNSTAAFSACLAALVAAGGGKMVLPHTKLGIYRGNIVIPPSNAYISVEITGDVRPMPLVGSVGKYCLCGINASSCQESAAASGRNVRAFPADSCDHVVVQSLEKSGPAVISATYDPSGFAGFSAVFVIITNLEVRTYDNPAISGIDVGNAQQCNIENVFVNTAVYSVQASKPTHATSGIITPRINNGASTSAILRNIAVSGYYNGIVVNEHTNGDAIGCDCNFNCLNVSNANHASRFGRVCANRNAYGVSVAGRHGFSVQQLDIEHAGPGQTKPANEWQKTIADINDPHSLSDADVTYWVVEGAVGPAKANVNGTFPSGAQLKIGGNNVQTRRVGAPPVTELEAAKTKSKRPCDWTVSQLTVWVHEEMGLPVVADAAAEEKVDGATAMEMDKEDWKELGSTGVQAAKLVATLKKL